MSRRPKQQASVSLFPFLAVLLCAMGALIFLLVITTRMIRSEVIRKQQTDTPALAQHEIPAVKLGFDETLPVVTVIVADDMPLIAPKPQFVRRDVPPPPPDLSRQLQSMRSELETLTATQQRAQRETDELLAKLAALNLEYTEKLKLIQIAESATQEIQTATAETQSAIDEHRTEGRTLSNEMQATRRAINERLAERKTDGTVKIVAYDGRNGTTRRPIPVECRSDRLTFLPEGIDILEQDLVGFTAARNPLLAAVEALSHYWAHKDGALADKDKPYVLLIVRPEGIPAYYAARKLLSEYKHPFGYELVGEEQQFTFDDADPNAMQLCRTAIDRLLKERGTPSESVADSAFPVIKPEKQNAEGTLETEQETGTSPASKPGVYRFVKTPRGLELVREDAPDGPVKSRGTTPAPTTPAPTAPTVTASTTGTQPRLISPGAERPLFTGAPEFEAGSVPMDQPLQPTAPRLPDGPQEFKVADNARDEIPYLRDPEEFLEPADDPFNPHPMTSPGNLPGNRATATTSATTSRAQLNQDAIESSLDNLASPEWAQDRPANGTPGQVGAPAPVSQKIAFRRTITVVITPESLRVANETPIALHFGMTTQELLSQTLRAIRADANQWETPPVDFYWKPQVKFVVYPGGNQFAERIRPYFEQRELISETDYRLSEPNETFTRDAAFFGFEERG